MAFRPQGLTIITLDGLLIFHGSCGFDLLCIYSRTQLSRVGSTWNLATHSPDCKARSVDSTLALKASDRNCHSQFIGQSKSRDLITYTISEMYYQEGAPNRNKNVSIYIRKVMGKVVVSLPALFHETVFQQMCFWLRNVSDIISQSS